MELIENYKNALQAIYDHVGFDKTQTEYPISNCADKYWCISNNEDEILFGNTVEDLTMYYGSFYSNEIYNENSIYEGELFTMILCTPNTDQMKLFKLFDNNKKVK